MYAIKLRPLRLKKAVTTVLRSCSNNASCAQASALTDFSFSDYSIIGFDLDHTICKYNLPALFELIYDSMAQFFVEKHNYPKSLLCRQPYEPHLVQKGIILDKLKGNFLKLDQDYKILKACHGSRLLSEEDIRKTYGEECSWKDAENIPNALCSNAPLEQPFYVFKDYFVTICIALCAKVVDTLDEGNGGPLPSYDFWKHFLEGLFYMYQRNNFKNDDGNFFPMLKKNPELYIEKCSPGIKKWLKNMRENKRTFLLTSSNFDSATFLAEYCLGSNWMDYFDVVVTFAKKPAFFSKASPFYAVEENLEIYKVSAKGMKLRNVYSQGNWNELQDFFSAICGVKHPKTLYVGDSLIEDVFAPSQLAACDTVAIVEEIHGENGKSSSPSEQRHLLESNHWGSFFASSKNLTLWARLLAEHSKLAVPNLEVLSTIGLRDRISSFSPAHPYSGYFPEVPFVFRR